MPTKSSGSGYRQDVLESCELHNGGLDPDTLSRHFAQFPDPVLVADRERRIIYLNRWASELLGCTLGAGDRYPLCTEILRVEMDGEAHCFIERCLEQGGSLNRMPVRLQDRQGSWYSLSVTASPIQDKQGNPAGCLAILRDIQADLMARPEVRLQHATLTGVLRNLPTPIFLVDSDLVITHMNEALEELSGYTSAEAVGKMTCAQLLSTNFCNTDECLLTQAAESKLPICGVRQMIRDRQGREVPIRATAFVVADTADQLVGGVEINYSMTPSREAERMLQLLTEMSQDGILIVDENRRIMLANARMVEITGRSKSELIGLDIGDILPPQHVENMTYLSLKLEEDQHQQMRFLTTLPQASPGKREERVFDTSIVAFRLGESVVTYFYFHDITERIQIEGELRKTNSFLTNIIQSSVDGIVVVDTRGRVLIFNEGAENILGYTAEEVMGSREIIRRIFQPELARELMRRMRSDEHGPPGKLNPTRLIFTRKDGEEVPVNFSSAIITEGGEEIASVGIFTDRRERVRLQRQLEEAQRQVVQAEKIASLGRLAAGVAHEVNNPLAGILIYAEALLKEVGENPQWREDLQEIVSQTLRCKQIVTRLLEFSRQALGQRVLFDLHELIGSSVDLLARQALFHDVHIVLDLEDDLPQIVGDPGELQQVCTNLMINAADAMQGKGELTIRTRSDPEAEQVILEFADTGPGIAPEKMDKIFEPFFTTKALGSGTGLGLSVVYGIIQRHLGSIELKSPPGGGATFIITLPFQAPAAPGEMPEA